MKSLFSLIIFILLTTPCIATEASSGDVYRADFGLTLLLWAALFVASQLLTPEPEVENARPKTLDDFNFPTATEGRILPLHWGTDLIKGPNVIWYGDLRSIPITEKVKINLFSSKKVTVGFRYYLGWQMGICHGPAVLKAIYIGDEKVWSGTKDTDGTIDIDIPDLKGTFYFYTGSKTQSVNSYLSQHQSPCPAYRGMCHGVWQGGYVGNNTTIKSWAFEVERVPTDLASDYSFVNTYDCNPMEIVYEIFTNTSWGYGYSSGEIDITDWTTQAQTLQSEGNGASFTMSYQKSATDIIKEIEKQIDGHFRIDAATGKWKCQLIRDGYSTSGLKQANVDTVNELVDFSRGSWDSTINIVRIMYKRRANDYQEGYAPAHDAANMQIQGRRVPATYSYIGLRDDTLANKLAWREIRSNSYPFAKLRAKVDRTFWNAYIGEVFLLTWVFKNFSVEDLAFRITRIDFGSPEEPEIVIDAVQDVFTWRIASFADSDSTNWSLPDRDLIPFPSGEQKAFEAPYAITRRDGDGDEGRIWTAAQTQGRNETGYQIMQRNNATPPSGSYTDGGSVTGFTWKGLLDTAVDNDDTTLTVLTTVDITDFLVTTNEDIGEFLYNLALIDDELIAFTDVTEVAGGYQLNNCLRGLCDTAQAAHAADAPIWLLATGGGLTSTIFDPDYYVDLKLLAYDQSGNKVDVDDAAITVMQINLDYRTRKPYPPTFMEFNSSVYPANVTITGDVDVEFNRRDYRIYNEYSQYDTDASTINGDFPSNNNTKYQLKLYDDTSVVYTTAWNDGSALITLTFEQILRYLDGLPSTLKVSLHTKHTYSSVEYEADQYLLWEADVNASTYDDDHWFGVCSTSTTCPYAWTNVPDSGTYAFSIPTSLSGDVEAQINSGGWVTVITSGNVSGNLTGVTAGDTIEVRHQDSSSSGEILLTVNSPTSSEDGFGILIFA